ncbi:hypothetical protein NHX12_001506 [Muraenolepis orangiensis]|uniref:Uncharacterized protein n=1 Tax=Muraenolepis orangiensis TaxID=630683 RepID=A0A9Q0E283_9TELE|nr:hypothetical protein NHX12_001506 [Muraenolepis orangiensis]
MRERSQGNQEPPSLLISRRDSKVNRRGLHEHQGNRHGFTDSSVRRPGEIFGNTTTTTARQLALFSSRFQ